MTDPSRGLIAPGIRAASGLTAAVCAAFLVVSLAVLAGLSTGPVVVAGAFPGGLDATFALDPLGAVFLFSIALVGFAAALYAPAYLETDRDHLSPALVAVGLPAFLLFMAAATAAADAVTFLFAYESVSVVSFLLVLAERRSAASRRAAAVYAVVTHAGTALVVLAFLAAAAPTGTAGALDWTSLSAGAVARPPAVRSVLFVLLLVGFGTKAGLVPLHVWLPLAHPRAPSHISALMSGVMVKVALLGLVRSIVFLGPGPAWWGWVLLAAGTASAVLGVLYALGEHDLKRLLAFHTVENVGIITMGLGVFALGLARTDAALAGLGLLAALYHVVNHAAFKGLLFLAAGSVQRTCRTCDLEALGGLWSRMPATAVLFLLGSAAISGLPPLNGFASEWLVYQGLVAAAVGGGSGPGRVAALAAIGGLALTAGLASACFVKAFGIAFLGVPRTDRALAARESPAGMVAGMAALAAACVGLGLFPGAVARLLDGAIAGAVSATGVSGASPAGPGSRASAWAGLETPIGVYAPLPVAVLLLAAGGSAAIVGRLLGGTAGARRHGTWNCGAEHGSRMAYTAGSFAKPIRVVFRRLLVQRAETEAAYVGLPSGRFRRVLRYEERVIPFWTERLYRPARDAFLRFSRSMRRLQAGPVNLYLGYLFAAAMFLLATVLR